MLKSVFKTGRKYMLFVFTSPNFKQFIFKLFFQPFHSERQFPLPLYRSSFVIARMFFCINRFTAIGWFRWKFLYLLGYLVKPFYFLRWALNQSEHFVWLEAYRYAFCFYCRNRFVYLCKERFKTGCKYMLFLFSSPNIFATFFENLFSTFSFWAITPTASFQKPFSLSQNVFCINRYHSDFWWFRWKPCGDA